MMESADDAACRRLLMPRVKLLRQLNCVTCHCQSLALGSITLETRWTKQLMMSRPPKISATRQKTSPNLVHLSPLSMFYNRTVCNCLSLNLPGEKLLKECTKQVDITSNTTTVAGNEALQARLSECNSHLKHILQLLDNVKYRDDLAETCSQTCKTVSDWLVDAQHIKAQCSRQWKDKEDLELLSSELEVGITDVCCNIFHRYSVWLYVPF